MGASDPDFMQSLARGLAVLEAFAALGPGQTVADLSHHTGLPRGVVSRCLHTLAVLGYVDQKGRHYMTRPHILRLADAYLADRSLAALAQPLLETLRDEVNESCSLGVLEGADVLYVARASRSSIMSVGLRVGSRLPAWCTSMGRVLLADRPSDERDALIAPEPLPLFTAKTTSDRTLLEALIVQAGRDGYAVVDQELEIGLRSIAVPVRGRGGAVEAALNVGCNAFERSVDELTTVILPHLSNIAALLSRQMGGK